MESTEKVVMAEESVKYMNQLGHFKALLAERTGEKLRLEREIRRAV